MKITDIQLYTLTGGTSGEKGAAAGQSQYWGGGWQANTLISNPMSVYPEYSKVRTSWMGPGQDPYAIEIHTDAGVTGCAVNYGGGAFACAVIQQHFKRFLIGQSPFNIERIWDQMERSTLPYGLGGVSPSGSSTNSRCQAASDHPSINSACPPSASAPARYSTWSPSPSTQKRSALARSWLGRAIRRWLDGRGNISPASCLDSLTFCPSSGCTVVGVQM